MAENKAPEERDDANDDAQDKVLARLLDQQADRDDKLETAVNEGEKKSTEGLENVEASVQNVDDSIAEVGIYLKAKEAREAEAAKRAALDAKLEREKQEKRAKATTKQNKKKGARGLLSRLLSAAFWGTVVGLAIGVMQGGLAYQFKVLKESTQALIKIFKRLFRIAKIEVTPKGKGAKSRMRKRIMKQEIAASKKAAKAKLKADIKAEKKIIKDRLKRINHRKKIFAKTTRWSRTVQKVKSIGSSAGSGIARGGKAVADGWRSVKGFFSNAMTLLKDGFTGLFKSKVSTWFKGLRIAKWFSAGTWFKTFLDIGKKWGTRFMKFLGPVTRIFNIVIAAFAGFAAWGATAGGFLEKGTASTAAALSSLFESTFGWVVDSVAWLLGWVADKLGFEGLGEWLKNVNATKAFMDGVEFVGTWLGQTAFELVQGIKKFGSDLGDNTFEMVQGVKGFFTDTIPNAWNGMIDSIVGGFSSFGKKLSSIGTDLQNRAKDMAMKAAKAVIPDPRSVQHLGEYHPSRLLVQAVPDGIMKQVYGYTLAGIDAADKKAARLAQVKAIKASRDRKNSNKGANQATSAEDFKKRLLGDRMAAGKMQWELNKGGDMEKFAAKQRRFRKTWGKGGQAYNIRMNDAIKRMYKQGIPIEKIAAQWNKSVDEIQKTVGGIKVDKSVGAVGASKSLNESRGGVTVNNTTVINSGGNVTNNAATTNNSSNGGGGKAKQVDVLVTGSAIPA